MRRPRVRPFVLAAVLLLVPGAASAAPAAVEQPGASSAGVGATGLGDGYFPRDGNGGIDVQSYRIRVRYGFARQRLVGRTVLSLRTTEALRAFHLDFLLPVQRVRVDGRRAAFRNGRHELRIIPARVLAADTVHRVVVRYTGSPAREQYLGQRNWLADRREVVTMNEPHMAPWWFPANDHPRDKALVQVAVTVPRGRQAVSNGSLLGRRVGRRGVTWRWAAAEPMAPYLAFFAAGRFRLESSRVDGVDQVLAVSRGLTDGETARAWQLMRRTGEVQRWLGDELTPYPFAATGGLTTALAPGFALETQTRPTYPYVGSAATWLVVHELAHQWFGNAVSVHSWRDIWLNEGAATFMEVRHEETHGGQSAQDWLLTTHDSHASTSRFWDVSLDDPGPDHLFATPVYVRGAMTLQALRHRIGEDDFWRLLRTWLTERDGSTGSTSQFEALAAKVSGEDLAGFFDAWLRERHRPVATTENGLA